MTAAAQRAATYARVSTEEQVAHGSSLADQIDRCAARARELGAAEVLPFTDEGVPGDLWERSGLMALLGAARARRFALFVCLDPDRLARKLVYQLLVTEELEKAGVGIEFLNGSWSATPEGRLFAQMRGAFAEYEKEKIRARTALGRAAKARRGGLPHYTRPYGYRWEQGGLVVDPGEAAGVTALFRLFAAAPETGFRELARRLQAVHPPRHGAWDGTAIARILRNPAYTGRLLVERYDARGAHLNRHRPAGQRVTYRRPKPAGAGVAVPVPRIVSPAEWAAVQSGLAACGRTARPASTFLLSGLLRCGWCGAPMYGKTQRAGGRTYRYHRCAGRRAGSCDAPQVRAGPLEGAVWARALDVLGGPAALARDTQALWLDGVPGPAGAAREAAEAALAAVERERGRVWAAYRGGWVDAARCEAALAELRSREEAARRLSAVSGAAGSCAAGGCAAGCADALATGAVPPGRPGPAGGSDPRTWAVRLSGLLDAVPFPVRRRVLLALVATVVVQPSPRGGGATAVLEVRLAPERPTGVPRRGAASEGGRPPGPVSAVPASAAPTSPS